MPFVISAIALSALASAALAAISCGGDGAAVEKETPFSCSTTEDISVTSIAAGTQPGWFEGKAEKGATSMLLRLELNEAAGAPMTAGEYKLGSGVDANYGTCQHCAALFPANETPEKATKVFFAVGGKMKLDSVTSPVSSSVKGSLSEVVFGEATHDPATGYTSAPSSGRCYRLAAVSWDTSPKSDGDCKSPSDCGDPNVAICDPVTNKCVAKGCDPAKENVCGTDSVCLVQSENALVGACYKTCVPFDSSAACPSGFVCDPVDANQTEGKCIKAGTAKLGEDCTNAVTNTGCAAGLTCAADGDAGIDGPNGFPVCRQACDFFSDKPGCPADTRCVYGGFCSPLTIDPAAIDEACLDTSDEGDACAAGNGIAAGVCVQSPPHKVLVCRTACRTGSSVYKDCDNEQICMVSKGESGIPACQPVLDEEEGTR